MSDTLTPTDYKLLAKLSGAKNGVYGGATVASLLGMIQRLQLAASTQEIELSTAQYTRAALTVAAHGYDTAEGIKAKGLPAPLEAECLELRQQHEDAKAWRAHHGPDCLKRYQAFYSEPYEAAGGAADICGEGDTLPELLATVIASGKSSVDEVLDMSARVWLPSEELAVFNKQVLDAYREANPPKPQTATEKQAAEEFISMMTMSAPAGARAYLNEENSPLTSGLMSRADAAR